MGTDIPAKAVWLEKRESGVAFIVRKQFLMVIKCSHVCVCVCVCVLGRCILSLSPLPGSNLACVIPKSWV